VIKISNILILVPSPNARGGITNYYYSLRYFFDTNIHYFIRGERNWPQKSKPIKKIIRLLTDNVNFVCFLISKRIKLVQTTTSFSRGAILRDSIFILLAKLFRCKVIVFFRGWDEEYIKNINKFSFNIIKIIYFKADCIIDLSQTNINTLINWGYRKKIYLETTCVADNLLTNVSLDFINNKYLNKKHFRITYIGRIEKSKGIYELLETFAQINNENFEVRFDIAGDGYETDYVKKWIIENTYSNIKYHGFVSGDDKRILLENTDIFFFPSHFEGMPNSVLEAMAMGIPVVTRNVGGLNDFFQNGINGYMTESKLPLVFKELLLKLITSPALAKQMSINNYTYAQQYFRADVVASRIQKIFEET